MKKHFALKFLLATMLSFVPLFAFASNIRWQWPDVNASCYRWQLDREDPDGWNLVDGNVLFADTYSLDPTEIHYFHIQSSKDGKNWSDSEIAAWGGKAARLVDVAEDIEIIETPEGTRNVRWQWPDVNASYYRWQLDGDDPDAWNVVEGNVFFVDTFALDPAEVHVFHIASSKDGKNWSGAEAAVWGGNVVHSESAEDIEIIDTPSETRNVRWQWPDVHAAYYRWQLEGEVPELWNVVDGNVLYVDTLGLYPDVVNHFYIQSSRDGKYWSDSTVQTWGSVEAVPEVPEEVEAPVEPEVVKKSHLGLRASVSPYSFELFDFFNGHDIEGAKYLTMTNYSAAGDAEFLWKTGWPMTLHLDAGYVVGLKNETIIPNASVIQYARLGGGLDLTFANKKLSFSVGVNGGELITFNARHWNPGSYLGGRILLEFNVTNHLLLGLQSRVAVSYQKATDPLLSSQTWLVDPLALTATYRF